MSSLPTSEDRTTTLVENRDRLLRLAPRALEVLEKNLGKMDPEADNEQAWKILEASGVAQKHSVGGGFLAGGDTTDLNPAVATALRSVVAGLAEGLGLAARDAAPAMRPVEPMADAETVLIEGPVPKREKKKPVLGRFKQ